MIPAVGAAAVGLLAGSGIRALRWATLTTAALLALAVWLSLGPVVKDASEPLGWPSLYALLHSSVPGYDALRVPARFASLFFLFLAVLASYGVNAIERRWRRAGIAAAGVVIIAFVLRDTPGRMPMNAVLPSEGLALPPAYLVPAPTLPPIYRALEGLRPGAVVAELPFGDPWYDVRYMFFSAMHQRRLLNGYSGIFPPSFRARQRILVTPLLDPGAATQALGGASHVVVHGAAWPDNTGELIGRWLLALGAVAIAVHDDATLYELPQREEYAAVGTLRAPEPPRR
jgi:hypothetical protein